MTQTRRGSTGLLEDYNERRPHGSLDGQSPMTVLVNNVSRNHT